MCNSDSLEKFTCNFWLLKAKIIQWWMSPWYQIGHLPLILFSGLWGGWGLSKLRGWVHPGLDHMGQPFTLTFIPMSNLESPINLMTVTFFYFGLWEETQWPGGNRLSHWETMQTPQNHTDPDMELNQGCHCKACELTRCSTVPVCLSIIPNKDTPQ